MDDEQTSHHTANGVVRFSQSFPTEQEKTKNDAQDAEVVEKGHVYSLTVGVILFIHINR